MFKKLLAFFAAMYMAVSFAAVDVNKATAAELDGIKGIGPSISAKIVDERKKGDFKNWDDFIARVKGIGEGNAAKFSSEGLTVGGTGFKGAVAKEAKKDAKAEAKAKTDADKAAKPAVKEEVKAEAKTETKAGAAKPAASAAKPAASAAKPAASAAAPAASAAKK